MEDLARQRAVDANNTLSWMLRAAADQPRILMECGCYTELSFLAEDLAASAAAAQAFADEMAKAAAAALGRAKLRKVA